MTYHRLGTWARRLALLLLVAAGLGADWPQFLGPTRNGVSTETGLLDTWPKKGPRVLWDRAVGAGYSSPVVAGGRLVLFHRVGDKEVVECLDPATGKRKWEYSYPTSYTDDYGKGDGPRSTPAVSGDRVFTLGAEGVLTCLGLRDGKKLWQKKLPDEYDFRKGFFGVATSPLVEGDLVLVNVGAKGAGIVAFHKETGKEAWKATDHEASYSSPVAATLAGVRQALFFTREGLVSLDPRTGKVRFSKRWRSRQFASVNAATPLVLPGDHVFLTASYGTGAVLLKVAKDGAEEVWKGNDILSAHYNTPVRVGRYLFGFDGRQEEGARLRCVDWKAGKVRWTEPPADAGGSYGCGAILAADGKLVILNESGELILAEANGEKYKEKARAAVLGSPCRAYPALASGRLYAHDGKKLVCLDLRKK